MLGVIPNVRKVRITLTPWLYPWPKKYIGRWEMSRWNVDFLSHFHRQRRS